MSKTQIKLGDTYKDPITGLKGTATSIHYHLHDVTRVGLQPSGASDTGSAKEPFYCTDFAIDPNVDREYKSEAAKKYLGKKLKDKITGFEGIAIMCTEFLFGCIHIMIQPDKLYEGKVIDAQAFDEQRFVLPEEKPLAPRGGPALHRGPTVKMPPRRR